MTKLYIFKIYIQGTGKENVDDQARGIRASLFLAADIFLKFFI